jgi:hypothetical protein
MTIEEIIAAKWRLAKLRPWEIEVPPGGSSYVHLVAKAESLAIAAHIIACHNDSLHRVDQEQVRQALGADEAVSLVEEVRRLRAERTEMKHVLERALRWGRDNYSPAFIADIDAALNRAKETTK